MTSWNYILSSLEYVQDNAIPWNHIFFYFSLQIEFLSDRFLWLSLQKLQHHNDIAMFRITRFSETLYTRTYNIYIYTVCFIHVEYCLYRTDENQVNRPRGRVMGRRDALWAFASVLGVIGSRHCRRSRDRPTATL